ncbi:hypothetical protein GLA29479_3182 [Lysobacter antibioticus]|nr:hypothetical protein GLA29479_3182 [Lysobacter antibioticus]
MRRDFQAISNRIDQSRAGRRVRWRRSVRGCNRGALGRPLPCEVFGVMSGEVSAAWTRPNQTAGGPPRSRPRFARIEREPPLGCYYAR